MKNTKNNLKKALLFTGLIVGTTCINKRVFENAKTQRNEDNMYDWKHGKIRYKKTGKGNPILLIHDTLSGSGLHEWDNTIDYFAKNNTVYTIDLLGYGFSSKPNISYSGYLYVTLINDFINNVIQNETIIIANGTSSLFAIMAKSFNEDKIAKIVLVSPKHIGAHEVNKYPTLINRMAKDILKTSLIGTSIYNVFNSKLAYKLWKKILFENKDSLNQKTLEEIYLASHYGNYNAKISNSSYITKYFYNDTTCALKKINIPILVIWGHNDTLNLIENFNKISFINDKAELIIFKKTKSMPHIENPKSFVKVVNEFIYRPS